MKTAAELFTETEFYDYQPMLNSFGEILLQVDDDDWAGDSRVLYLNDSKYGWLQFGWGSCSGCDALQSCTTVEEVQELIDELRSEIKWFDTKSEVITFFKEHDFRGDYSFGKKEQEKFIRESLEILRNE